MKKISFFLLLIFTSIISVSCPGIAKPYIVLGKAKITITDENGKHFKKEEAKRFIAYQVGNLYKDNNQKLSVEDDSNLTYFFSASESGKQIPTVGKLDDNEKNILLNELLENHGFVIIDLKNEYESCNIKLKEIKYKEIDTKRRGVYSFEFEHVLRLKKR